MFDKLENVEKRYEELNEKIADPAIIANQSEWQKLMKEHADIEEIVQKYRFDVYTERVLSKIDLERAYALYGSATLEGRNFKTGDVIAHFKREVTEKNDPAKLIEEPNLYLYEYIGVSRHTETKEECVVYRPLYSSDLKDIDFYNRPCDMFMGEVDHEKYPDVEQKYRFEVYTKKLTK